MKNYKVVTGTSREAFAASIESYLNQGWQLEGNLVLAPNTLSNTGAGHSNVTFAQAITCSSEVTTETHAGEPQRTTASKQVRAAD